MPARADSIAALAASFTRHRALTAPSKYGTLATRAPQSSDGDSAGAMRRSEEEEEGDSRGGVATARAAIARRPTSRTIRRGSRVRIVVRRRPRSSDASDDDERDDDARGFARASPRAVDAVVADAAKTDIAAAFGRTDARARVMTRV